ncbi:Hypothetical predicted protein [Olea europaea subsp. europaea]|uniref:Uncharacterized protein n=1 Tax=Olea europaea subsp. europaea TaxID=158383 RepID=A0A8S0TXG3_OLEEU|nr:Hypothetical predicted protein [Olea europaea subsp. europaea]
MDFEFLIPEDARLRADISQSSNLKYVKTVMDHFDEWQCEDFSKSSLRCGLFPEGDDFDRLIERKKVEGEIPGQLRKKIPKGQEEEEERDYMHGALLLHFHADLGVRGDFEDWGTLRSMSR